MSRARIEQFDGLRAFAFLAVFARHMLHVRFAQFGVDLFFVLSGFLITQNLIGMRDLPTGRAFKVFFYHRLLRIVPPYYLALVLLVATSYLPIGESPWYFAFASNIRDSIMPTIGGPPVTMWSICVEEQFYLVWPFVILLVPRRALVPVLVATILAAPLVRYGFRENSDAVYRLMISRMDLLAFGGLVGLVDLRAPTWLRDHRRHVIALALAVLGVFTALTLADPLFEQTADQPFFDVLGYSLVAIEFTCVLVLVRIDTGWLSRLLCRPALRYVGKISYMAYLIHLLIIRLLLEVPMPGPVRIVVALAATVAVASASWYLVEKPLQRLRIQNAYPTRK
ncbi:MAG: acyltransferase [Proteobacteria bacterium]|nr:acyltransferase [Pseudomonadota bacterium]